MVVLGPTSIWIRAVWLRCDLALASSSGPLVGTRPQVAGSYWAR
jgi:hypothetical protein